jgi:hypothetical protein
MKVWVVFLGTCASLFVSETVNFPTVSHQEERFIIFHFPAAHNFEKSGFYGHPYANFSKIEYISRFLGNVYPRGAFCIYHFFWDALLGKNEVLQMDDVASVICHDRIEKSTMQFQKQFLLFLVFRVSDFSTFLYSHIFSCFQNTFCYHSYYKMYEN